MSVGAIRYHDVVAPGALTLHGPSRHGLAARLRRVVALTGDLLVLAGILFCIPFVILAIGIPITLFVQLLLWVGRLL